MNWNEIKKKFPNAWEYLINSEWIKKQSGYTEDDKACAAWLVSAKSDRLLFDFFDGEEIYIEVSLDGTRHGYGSALWTFMVVDWKKEDIKVNWSKLERSRPQAENEAYLRAFEILEEKKKTSVNA